MEEKEEALKRACLAAALSVLLLFLTLFLSGWVQIQADSVLRESVKSPFLLSTLLYGVRALLYAGSFGIPIWIGFREMRRNGLTVPDSPVSFPRGAFLGCLLLPGIVFAASRVWSWALELLRSFGITFREPSLLSPERPEEWIFYLILIVIVAPVLEEWFFRGVLLPLLRPFGDWFAILFSAILFGLMHGSVPQFLYPAAAGAALGWCVLRSRSVWVGVCMHAANNLYAFLIGAHGQALQVVAGHLDGFSRVIGDARHIVCVGWVEGDSRQDDDLTLGRATHLFHLIAFLGEQVQHLAHSHGFTPETVVVRFDAYRHISGQVYFLIDGRVDVVGHHVDITSLGRYGAHGPCQSQKTNQNPFHNRVIFYFMTKVQNNRFMFKLLQWTPTDTHENDMAASVAERGEFLLFPDYSLPVPIFEKFCVLLQHQNNQ